MLTVDAVVPFLLERGLIEERRIVDGALQVIDVSRKHHNFKLLGDDEPGFFLKQGVGREGAHAVDHEARLYEWFRMHPAADRLSELLPRCRLYDAGERTVVLDLVEDAQSLYEYHRRHRRLTQAIGRALGDSLATLHELTTPGLSATPSGQAVPERAAVFLLQHRPSLEARMTTSAGGLEVVRRIQRSEELCRALDRLHENWREPCVIHGDLRLDNCQLVAIAVRGRPPRVQFVDWEMGGVGDPAWDIGSIFAECLSAWLLSAPATRDSAPDDFLRLSRLPLQGIRPAMRAFWRSYVGRRQWDAETAAQWLERSVQYAGARLIQTACEEMQGRLRVPANVIYMVQLSWNVIERPREAATVLLGVSDA